MLSIDNNRKKITYEDYIAESQQTGYFADEKPLAKAKSSSRYDAKKDLGACVIEPNCQQQAWEKKKCDQCIGGVRTHGSYQEASEIRKHGSHRVKASVMEQPWARKEHSRGASDLRNPRAYQHVSKLTKPGVYQVDVNDMEQMWMKKDRSNRANDLSKSGSYQHVSELRRPGSRQVDACNIKQPWVKKQMPTLRQDSANGILEDNDAIISESSCSGGCEIIDEGTASSLVLDKARQTRYRSSVGGTDRRRSLLKKKPLARLSLWNKDQGNSGNRLVTGNAPRTRKFKAVQRKQTDDTSVTTKAKAQGFDGFQLKTTAFKSKRNVFNGVNKANIRDMVNLRTREEEVYEEYLDEEVEGIWGFEEKERACVLFSQLNTLINEKKWCRVIKRLRGMFSLVSVIVYLCIKHFVFLMC